MILNIKRLSDMHVHFRHFDISMMERVVPYTAMVCDYAVVMPNTTPPTITPEDVIRGMSLILGRSRTFSNMKPLMMMKMESNCTPEMIRAAWRAGAVGTKSYPEGVTTGSEVGLTQDVLRDPPQNLLDCWEEQQRLGMISSWHGEMPDSFVMDAEKDFLFFIHRLRSDFPRLKIVLEHITTKESADMVKADLSGNLAATVTFHHLRINLDHVLKDKLRPHNYCKPIAKREEDRLALLSAVFAGHPNFFLGSDSAPHLRENKECASGCAGIYTAPLLAQGLASLFDHYDQLHMLENFACVYGPRFYGLAVTEEKIRLEKSPFLVPTECDGVVPFLAGQILNWSVC